MECGKGQPSSSSNSNSFPFGLHVLVVDDDPTCLKVVEKMLTKCRYKVTTCEHATLALNLLQNGGYDVVLTDVHMPDMDGFKLLEIIGLGMDLPVVMMSADCDVNVAKRGLEHGACYYLMKPISMDEIRNIWQHLIRKKNADEREIGHMGSDGKETEPTGSIEEENTSKNTLDDAECASSVDEGSSKKQHKRRKEAKEDEDGKDCDEEHTAQKKLRVIWHSGLHSKFLNAVSQLGFRNAVPKKILELMNVPGLTRENVASHLQKYRMFLRRLEDAQQSPRRLSCAFPENSKLSLAVRQMMINYQGQRGYSKLLETPHNLLGSQQNFTSSMPLGSINSMPLLNQTSQINPLATFSSGQPNGPSSMQPLLSGNSLVPRAVLPQQNDMKSGSAMVPQHVKMGSSPLVDTMPMTHQRIQARPGHFGCGPVDNNFGTMNVQNSNSFGNMGNVESINRLNQPPPFNYTSNYSGLHLTSSGGLYGMAQTGPLGEESSSISQGCNLLSEKKKGKLLLEMDVKSAPPRTPDFVLDPFNKFVTPCQFSANFPTVAEETNDFVMEEFWKVEGDSPLDFMKSSTIGSSSATQPFDNIDLEDLIFKQHGTDPMEFDLDIYGFPTDGSSSDNAKEAPK